MDINETGTLHSTWEFLEVILEMYFGSESGWGRDRKPGTELLEGFDTGSKLFNRRCLISAICLQVKSLFLKTALYPYRPLHWETDLQRTLLWFKCLYEIQLWKIILPSPAAIVTITSQIFKIIQSLKHAEAFWKSYLFVLGAQTILVHMTKRFLDMF